MRALVGVGVSRAVGVTSVPSGAGGIRVASQTCERLVIRRPHHAAPAQNHAGIKTTPRD